MFCRLKPALSYGVTVRPVSLAVSVEINRSHYFWYSPYIFTSMQV